MESLLHARQPGSRDNKSAEIAEGLLATGGSSVFSFGGSAFYSYDAGGAQNVRGQAKPVWEPTRAQLRKGPPWQRPICALAAETSRIPGVGRGALGGP
jgi:hypothetical protein